MSRYHIFSTRSRVRKLFESIDPSIEVSLYHDKMLSHWTLNHKWLYWLALHLYTPQGYAHLSPACLKTAASPSPHPHLHFSWSYFGPLELKISYDLNIPLRFWNSSQWETYPIWYTRCLATSQALSNIMKQAVKAAGSQSLRKMLADFQVSCPHSLAMTVDSGCPVLSSLLSSSVPLLQGPLRDHLSVCRRQVVACCSEIPLA